MNDMDLLRLKYIIKRFSEFAIIVMDETTKSLLPLFDGPDVLSSLLGYPLPIRIGRDTSQMDPPGSNLQ